jgi:hypothetical protein
MYFEALDFQSLCDVLITTKIVEQALANENFDVDQAINEEVNEMSNYMWGQDEDFAFIDIETAA